MATHMFSGKAYELASIRQSEIDARKKAEHYHDIGYRTRVVQDNASMNPHFRGKWFVYIRPVKKPEKGSPMARLTR